MRTCRIVTGRINTSSTYAGDGDWIERYADKHCGEMLVNGACPLHPKKPAERKRKAGRHE